MREDNLPLYELFTRLRDAGFSLRVSDYNLLLHVLLSDDDTSNRVIVNLVTDRSAVKNLCQTLWVKSASQRLEFEAIFDEIFFDRKLDKEQLQSLKSPSQKEETNSTVENQHEEQPQDQDSTADSQDDNVSDYFFFAPAPSPESAELIPSEDRYVKAVRMGKQRDWVSFKPSGLPNEYFPVTARQMEQNWYALRCRIREGVGRELDIAATIDQTKRRGKFFHPVLRPRQVKSSQLVLFIDQKGSMQPFHVLSRLLVNTALQTGCLETSNCYYFHNYPRSVLYSDPQFQTELSLVEVMARLHPERTAVLIFSDAGAARGNFILRRIEMTIKFLENLQQHSRATVWLNPMPMNYWDETTAEAIANAKIVQMFPADFSGFQNAMRVLQ